MLISDGYSLFYDKNRNMIHIGLPQTLETLTNTWQQTVDRRTDVQEMELLVLLNITELIFRKDII